LIYYSYTVVSENKVSLASQLTGPLSVFEIVPKETFNSFSRRQESDNEAQFLRVVEIVAAFSPIRNSPLPNSISRRSPMRRTMSAPSA
jgi:hypothetical protein